MTTNIKDWPLGEEEKTPSPPPKKKRKRRNKAEIAADATAKQEGFTDHAAKVLQEAAQDSEHKEVVEILNKSSEASEETPYYSATEERVPGLIPGNLWNLGGTQYRVIVARGGLVVFQTTEEPKS